MTQARTQGTVDEPAALGPPRASERRPTGRILAGAATIAVLAGAWFVAARWAWHTTLPSSLQLPRLSPAAYFTPGELHRTRDYNRLVDTLWLASKLAGFTVLAGVALRARSLVRRIGIGPVGTGVVLAVLIAALSAAAAFPFALVSTWWDHRYGLSRGGYADVVAGAWAGLIGQALLLALVVAVVMGLAARLGRAWWLGATPVFVALVLLVTFTGPYLLLGTHELRRPALRQYARALTRATGTVGTPIRVQDVHDRTTEANAFSIGIGPSRRVILWDTILRFPRREVRVVMAHELGHVARGHLRKGVVWFALFAVVLLALLAELTRRWGGLANPAAVPLALLIATALSLLAMPAENLVSRRYEAEADWVALRTTNDVPAARALFRRFATADLAEPNPPTWDYLWLENHPTIMQRIAMVEAWSRRSRVARSAARASPGGS